MAINQLLFWDFKFKTAQVIRITYLLEVDGMMGYWTRTWVWLINYVSQFSDLSFAAQMYISFLNPSETELLERL